ncbi:XRE family transcriptional regulator [Myxococcota bacterium]|nr:XRE family transcriptional regulator [Myxococcota bacterium]
MAMNWTKIGQQVAAARGALSLSQAALADRMSLDRTAITRIERGERNISALELVKLGEILRRPLEFFLTPTLSVTSYRAEDRENDANNIELSLILDELRLDAETLIKMGHLTPPSPLKVWGRADRVDEAVSAAAATRRHLGLGEGPIFDLAEITASLGLYVFVSNPNTGMHDIDGAYRALGSAGVAWINGAKKVGRRRFSLAHELGHHLLDDEYRESPVLEGSAEQNVNIFAAHFLVSSSGLRAYWGTLQTDSIRDRAIYAAAHFGVSWSSICSRIRNAEILDQNVVESLKEDPPRYGDYLSLSVDIKNELSPIYLSKLFGASILAAYKHEHLSEGRTIEMMRGALSQEDLPSLQIRSV